MPCIVAEIGAWTEQVERFLLNRLGCPELARDLAQEAAARLLRASRADFVLSEPRAWMFRTARNLAVDEVRRRLPNPLGIEAMGTVVDPASLPGAEAGWVLEDREMTRAELLGLLPDAVARLPQHYQRLIQAHYGDGLNCEAVAERERITVQNAKVRLFRARRRLRELLLRAVRRAPESESLPNT